MCYEGKYRKRKFDLNKNTEIKNRMITEFTINGE